VRYPARVTRRRDDSPAPLTGAARALLAGVLGLLALRVTAALAPGRALWGVDLGRDLAPLAFVVPLALLLLTCVPALVRRAAALLPEREAALAVTLALALAAFAWTHPDRALFTGDTSLRHGAFAQVADPRPFAEQALAGDLWLHHALPRAIAAHTPWDADTAGRALGALLAALTVLAAWRLARALGATGATALAVMAVATASGALALHNGYAKASVEVAALTTVLALGLAHALRDGSGLGLAGLATALALLLHRSALALLPGWAMVLTLAWRARRVRGPVAWLGALAPPLVLAMVGPRLLQVITGFDVAHHTAGGAGSTLAAALAPAHLADVANTLALIAPLAPLVPLLLALPPRAPGREALAWGAFALPPLALLVLVGPPARAASERADGLGTIGLMRMARGDLAGAQRALAASVEAAPNPRAIVDLGKCSTLLGDPAGAMALYRRAATASPMLVSAWRGIAASAAALGDRAAMLEAITRIEALEPGSPTVAEGRAWLEANPAH
jgi:tetratricopeptide (TPR) repeat protein